MIEPVIIGKATLYNMDCMEYMAPLPDKYFDLAIVDPNYGRKEHGGTDRSKFVTQKNGSKTFVGGNKYCKKSWDEEPADKDYFRELMRVSQHQIIFGCNYYEGNFGPGRIVWDKMNDGSDQSDCEIAYNSLNERVDIVRYMWRGMFQGLNINSPYQQGNKALNEVRIHPTQKPVKLYEWLLNNYAKEGYKIIDTHGGSLSNVIACLNLGFEIECTEIDRDYFESAVDRVRKSQQQQRLFA